METKEVFLSPRKHFLSTNTFSCWHSFCKANVEDKAETGGILLKEEIMHLQIRLA